MVFMSEFPQPPRESWSELARAIDYEARMAAVALEGTPTNKVTVRDTKSGTVSEEDVILLSERVIGGNDPVTPTHMKMTAEDRAALLSQLGSYIAPKAAEMFVDSAEESLGRGDRGFIGVNKNLGILEVTAHPLTTGGYRLRADANRITPEHFLNVTNASADIAYKLWRLVVEQYGDIPYSANSFPGLGTRNEKPTDSFDVSGDSSVEGMIPMAPRDGTTRPWLVLEHPDFSPEF